MSRRIEFLYFRKSSDVSGFDTPRVYFEVREGEGFIYNCYKSFVHEVTPRSLTLGRRYLGTHIKRTWLRTDKLLGLFIHSKTVTHLIL